MTDTDGSLPNDENDRLIRELAAGLRPVRRLRAPWLRAALWVGLCAAVSIALIAAGGASREGSSAAELPERLAFVFSVLTATSAAVAALSLAVPGRSLRWALLPLPPLVLWLGASGWDCLAATRTVDDGPTPMACFQFIFAMSLPLAAVLFLLLRRAYCLHPKLTATLAGFASATAAAAMLEAYHAHAMPLSDLIAHFGTVLLVTVICRALLPRTLL